MEEKTAHIDLLFWKISMNDDEKAFQELFFDFFPSLCVFAHKYIDNWDTCEDIVQDAFYHIWKGRKSIEIKTSFRNFLLTSVRNLCLDHLRKKQLEHNWQKDQSNIEYESYSLHSHQELENMFYTALAKLPENTRTIFELNRFEGKTYKEIANEKNISVKTVEAQMTKALKLLRIELKDFLPFFILFLEN